MLDCVYWSKLPASFSHTRLHVGVASSAQVYRPEEIEGRKRNRTDVLLKNAAAAGQAQRQAAAPVE